MSEAQFDLSNISGFQGLITDLRQLMSRFGSMDDFASRSRPASVNVHVAEVACKRLR